MGAGHDHGGQAMRAGEKHRGRLWWAAALLAVFMVVEAVAAFATGSLALLSDAGHMFTDVLGIAMALAAIYAAGRAATDSQRTFGLYRLEVLAALAERNQNWEESEKYSRAWIQLDPEDFPSAYLYNAIANARLNKIEQAETSARKGVTLDKERRIPRLSYVLGLILMQKQEFSESAKCLRTYLELAPNAKDAAQVREQLTKMEATARP